LTSDEIDVLHGVIGALEREHDARVKAPNG
jgi:hypothetical protein